MNLRRLGQISQDYDQPPTSLTASFNTFSQHDGLHFELDSCFRTIKHTLLARELLKIRRVDVEEFFTNIYLKHLLNTEMSSLKKWKYTYSRLGVAGEYFNCVVSFTRDWEPRVGLLKNTALVQTRMVHTSRTVTRGELGRVGSVVWARSSPSLKFWSSHVENQDWLWSKRFARVGIAWLWSVSVLDQKFQSKKTNIFLSDDTVPA